MSESKIKVELKTSQMVKLRQSNMMMDAVTNAASKEGKVEKSFVGWDRVQVIVNTEGRHAY